MRLVSAVALLALVVTSCSEPSEGATPAGSAVTDSAVSSDPSSAPSVDSAAPPLSASTVAEVSPSGAPSIPTPSPSLEGDGGAFSVCDLGVVNEPQSINTEYLFGADSMGFHEEDGVAEVLLWRSANDTTLLIAMFSGASGEVLREDGFADCTSFSTLVFNYAAGVPVVGEQVEYNRDGDPTDGAVDGVERVAFFVDGAEDPPMLTFAGDSIDYMGTAGVFSFTQLNELGELCQSGFGCGPVYYHAISFSVTFVKVNEGMLDETVQTRLSSELTFLTTKEL